jgi:hypothetical protein
MTELQEHAIRQATAAIATFERDHFLIRTGDIALDPGDAYNADKVDEALILAEEALSALCLHGGSPNA